MLAGYLWIFLFLDKVVSSNGTLLFSKARSGSVVANVYNLSLDACRKECKARPSCHSINYFRLSKKCQLNDVNDVTGSSVEDCVGSVYALKSDWSDDSFASCNCRPGQKCILKDGQPECIVAECKRLGWQESADMNSVGSRTRHSIQCTQDIAQFDRDRTFTSSTAPLICSADGKWRLVLPRDGPCLFVAAVMRPNTKTDPYFAWNRSANTSNELECLLNVDCTKTYRNAIVDNWNALNVSEIRLSIFKGGAEVHYVVFNGTGSNHTNWFTQARISSSSWVDIMTASVQSKLFCLDGVPRDPKDPNARRFLMAESYKKCDSDKGWLSAAYYPNRNATGYACDYDLRDRTVPAFLFSKQNSSTIFQSANTELAEYIYILIQYEHEFLTL